MVGTEEDTPAGGANWKVVEDGGGEVVWHRAGFFSRDVCRWGGVRWVDFYGGCDFESGGWCVGKWMEWTQFQGYYELDAQPKAWRDRVEAQYERTLAHLRGDSEATDWLAAYGALRGAGVPAEERHQCQEGSESRPDLCDTPGESEGTQDELNRMDEWLRRGEPFVRLIDARQENMADGGVRVTYLVHWEGFPRERYTWETEEQLCRGGVGRSSKLRRDAVRQAIGELRDTPVADRYAGWEDAVRDVELRWNTRLEAEAPHELQSNMRGAMQDELGVATWDKLTGPTADLRAMEGLVRRAHTAGELHAWRVRQPDYNLRHQL